MKNNKSTPLFINFEGGEMSGKTTQITLLAQKLKESGYQVITTLEPGGTDIGQKIREILLDKKNSEMDDLCELFLFLADRAQHMGKKVLPMLQKGYIVISDRGQYSTIVYQGYGTAVMSPEELAELNDLAAQERKPDIVFYLDIDPKKAFQRARDEIDRTRIDEKEIDFHRRIRAGFLAQSKQHTNWYVVDAEQSPAMIAHYIWQRVKNRLLSSSDKDDARG